VRHDRLGNQEHKGLAPAWIDKLKVDQRAIGANLAVLVSTALPAGIVEFGRLDGVWVAGLHAWPALAVALREQLIEVAFAHAAAEGKSEKMDLLYNYLAGDQFRRRIEATVEAFTALRNGLTRERNAMERIWNEREKADRPRARQHRRHVRRGARHRWLDRATGASARARRDDRTARRRDGGYQGVMHTLVTLLGRMRGQPRWTD
jgi:hypothetical protein